jgi:glycosyltransferase involved in cell wall biosynthesis
LARGFAERGYEVDLVLAKAEGPYLSQVPDNIRVIDLKSPRVLYSLPGLIRYLRQERPHALLSALDHANIVALWAKKLSRVPIRVVVSVHSTLSRASTNATSIRARLIPSWARIFYPWADAVVAVSKGVADDLIKLTELPQEKVHVIYNPVVTPELFAKADEPLDHPWFEPSEPPVILSVGRLTPAKDYSTLIKAFALVRKEMPARLMILGEGEERPKLEALIRDLGLEKDVALPGFVNNPYKYMKHAAVFVLSSQWEGLPTVLIEALALGIPVVSTDCPSGPSEILEGGKWGILVPVGNIEALAKAISNEIVARQTKEINERFKDFALDKVTIKYLEILNLVL